MSDQREISARLPPPQLAEVTGRRVTVRDAILAVVEIIPAASSH
jgi:hypothetical protein